MADFSENAAIEHPVIALWAEPEYEKASASFKAFGPTGTLEREHVHGFPAGCDVLEGWIVDPGMDRGLGESGL